MARFTALSGPPETVANATSDAGSPVRSARVPVRKPDGHDATGPFLPLDPHPQERPAQARSQALDAYRMAVESIDTKIREDWLKVANLWEQLAAEYQRIAATMPGSRLDETTKPWTSRF